MRGFLLWTAIVGGFGLLTVAARWPLFSDPARRVLDGAPALGPFGQLANADVDLMIWGLAWDAHAIATRPSSLFHANTFHPAPLALAGTDHYLGHVPIHAPLLLLTGNPVVAYQGNLLLAFALCGATATALARHFGLSWGAALLAGLVYAMCPIRSLLPVHGQLVAGQYLPLALLLLDRTLQRGAARDAVLLALAVTLQAACGAYFAYMTFVVLGAWLAVSLVLAPPAAPRRLGVAVLAIGTAAVLTALSSLPYLEREEIPSYAGSEMLVLGAAHPWRTFLTPPGAIRGLGWPAPPHGIPCYVGIVALLLSLLAIARRRSASAPRHAVPGAAAIAGVSWLLAIGSPLVLGELRIPMPYELLARTVPGFGRMRAPSRFGFVVMLGVALLAGIGMDLVLSAVRRRRGRSFAAALAAATASLVLTEYDVPWDRPVVRSIDLDAARLDVHRTLRTLPRGPVLVLPPGSPHDPRSPARESAAMVASTIHWRPLLNGYSGYAPRTYPLVMALARALPDPEALRLLQGMTGLRYVVVMLDQPPRPDPARWESPAGLKRLPTSGPARLFEVTLSGPAELREPLLRPAPGTTAMGTVLAALPEAARRSSVALAREGGAASTIAGWPFELEVLVTNPSDAAWPVMAEGEHVVRLATRWIAPGGRVLATNGNAGMLPWDLAPGQTGRATLGATAPAGHDALTLEIGVLQGSHWFDGALKVPMRVVTPAARPGRDPGLAYTPGPRIGDRR